MIFISTETVSKTGTGASSAITYNGKAQRIGFGVQTSGTVTYTVQHTYDGTNYFDHPTAAAKTAAFDGSYLYPVAAIRLNVTGGSGTATMTAVAN